MGVRPSSPRAKRVRKTILGHEDDFPISSSNEWFGVEAIAGIAVTSEADDAPIERPLSRLRDRLAGRRTRSADHSHHV